MERIVNGERIALTPQEIAARQAEELAAQADPAPEQIAAYKAQIADAIAESDERLRALALTFLQITNGMATRINELQPAANLPTYSPTQLRAAVLNKVRDPQ